MIKNKIYYFRYIILLICVGGMTIVFQNYIQNKYKELVKTPHFIQDFRQASEKDLPSLKKKYGIEYARIKGGKIVETSGISLPQIDLITVSITKNPLVLQSSMESNLLSVRPYVFRQSLSYYILFPLIYPNKKDSLLVIKKIVP